MNCDWKTKKRTNTLVKLATKRRTLSESKLRAAKCDTILDVFVSHSNRKMKKLAATSSTEKIYKDIVDGDISLLYEVMVVVKERRRDEQTGKYSSVAVEKKASDFLRQTARNKKAVAVKALKEAKIAFMKKTKRTQNKQKIKERIFQRKEFFFSLLLLNNAPLPQKKRSNTFRSNNNNRSLNDVDDKMTTLMQMPDGRLIQPQIVLLKEGTDTSQGKGQLISNINACMAIVDTIRTTLGPRGLDKLVVDNRGVTTITNDGATIMKLLEIVHPAVKTLVDIARSQDAEVGDGTTTVVLLCGEFLREAKPFIEDGVHPMNIIRAFRKASELAVQKVKEVSVSIEGNSKEEKEEMLKKCAMTTLSSKLVGGEKEFFAKMVVDAVGHLDQDLLDPKMIGVKKVLGASMRDSFLVDGVAFKKTFSYAGFEQMTKKMVKPKILALNLELELKSEKDNAEVRLSDPSKYQEIVDAEWNIIYDKLEKCVQSGANVVLSRLAIGDLATQYFADRGLFCAGRVEQADLDRCTRATGAAVQTTVNDLNDEQLGTCDIFEEIQVGSERFNVFRGCTEAKTCTLVLRGGAEQFIEEAARSLNDAIEIVRRATKNAAVVPGGGAIDMELSKCLKEYARTVEGKSQLFIHAFARALEVIPRQLCDNSGCDATDVLNKLRQKHASPNHEGLNFGVDVNSGGILDTFANFIWEPALVKCNAIAAACEATCLILSIDETVRNPRSEDAQGGGGGGRGGGRGGRGGGRGMRR